MNCRKTINRIILYCWSLIAVVLCICSITLSNAHSAFLFKASIAYDAGNDPSSVAIGDLNGDGNPDLVVTNTYSHGTYLLLGNGDGSFQSAVNYGVGYEPSYVVIGDLNGDCNLDLVTDPVTVLLGNGDGTFQTAMNYNTGERPISVTIGDLNGDTKPDLAVANWFFK